MHEKLAYLIKHNQCVQLLYRVIMSACFKFLGLFIKIDNYLVLFSSYGGKQYSDSPKILYEKMQIDSRFKDFHYVWVFENPGEYKLENSEVVRADSLKYFLTALKAKVWVTNVNIERGLNFKKKGTIYLNTWHGTGPKKGGNAVKGRKDYDFSRVDIFCCDGKYTHDVFIKYWNAKEESMIWCGRPREDELFTFTQDDRKRIRRALKIPENKKMILYMPTWREYGNRDLEYLKWQENLEKDYIFCVRAHHFSNADVFHDGNHEFFRDVTLYPNVNELYFAADILISDYSSAFFDYGLLGKPMYCYAYDYEQYRDNYGLFMDLEHEFPNGVMRKETEVIAAIKGMDYTTECRKSSAYCATYVKHSENATQRCLDEIYKKWSTKS